MRFVRLAWARSIAVVQADPENWEVEFQVTHMRLLANRGYAAGEELRTAYDNVTAVPNRPECHSKMLIMYGFTDGHKDRDCFHLKLLPQDIMTPPDAEDADEGGEKDYRNSMLAAEKLGPKPIYLFDLHADVKLGKALSVLRILLQVRNRPQPPTASHRLVSISAAC